MEIQTRKEKAAVVVSVKGRMDAVTAPEFDKQVVDDVRYRREGNFNILNLIIQRGEGK